MAARLAAEWRALRYGPVTPRPDEGFWLRCLRGLLALDTWDRVLMIAGQGFVALVPLLIVTATFSSSADGEAVARHVIERLDLSDEVAVIVLALFERPPDADSSLSIVSVAFLLVSVNSFGRSLRRSFERAWDLPTTLRFRGTADGTLGLAAILAVSSLLAWITISRSASVAELVGDIALQLAVGTGGWLLVVWIFLDRRVSPLRLLPGAVFAAAAHTVASWWVSVYLPGLMSRQAERYGPIGVSLALVSWLVVIGVLIVAVGIVGAELDRALRRWQEARR